MEYTLADTIALAVLALALAYLSAQVTRELAKSIGKNPQAVAGVVGVIAHLIPPPPSA